MSEEEPIRKRRARYKGTHPKKFEEKYKELNPEKYSEDLEKIIASGKTPAGMHRPIMVSEVLEALAPKPGEVGVDGTLGYGGHTIELLGRILPGGKLFALDVDPIEIARTEERLRKLGYTENELVIRRINFAGIPKLLPESPSGFDFILADLGVSSMQLDNPARGFTYKSEGPLDLRLNPEKGRTAATLLKTLTPEAIGRLLWKNSDQPHPEVIADALYERRDEILTTTDLSEAIRNALETKFPGMLDKEITRSIRRTFQAFRIEVNEEFNALNQFLRNLPNVLKAAGRVAVLSFHSGEDKRVATAFAEGLASGIYKSISTEPIRSGAEERYANPRAKSALLRWALRS